MPKQARPGPTPSQSAPRWGAVIPLAAVLLMLAGWLWPELAWAQWGRPQPEFAMPVADTGERLGSKLMGFLVGGLVGGLIGAFFSHKARALRMVLAIVLAIVIAIGAVMLSSYSAGLVGALVGGVTAWMLLRDPPGPPGPRDTTLGSAEWATLAHLQQHGLLEGGPPAMPPSAAELPWTSWVDTSPGSGGVDAAAGRASLISVPNNSAPELASPAMAVERPAGAAGGIFLGMFDAGGQLRPLHYRGDRHLLTIAPTRSGKGISAIVPNLLTYTGSALVIDPKGENALITAARRGKGDGRIPGLGQAVHVVDPWGITGLKSSCFNPLEWLINDAENATENAMILAESIVPRTASKGDPFWDEEARSLLVGLMLHVARHPAERANRTLGRVREIIVLDSAGLSKVLEAMIKGDDKVAASTASRSVAKEVKLFSSVLAALQSHTHFLDSPAVQKSLSRTDFLFEFMKEYPVTIYLVLPADRLDAFGRWLRLLVQQAITVNARNIQKKPTLPILFILDELASLGRLSMVEQAFGLMAGFGMQLWGVVQDASQLKRIYDDGWETFIGNAGVIQYFGSRDHRTAEYFSKLCGVTTVEKISITSAITSLLGRGWKQGGEEHSSSTSTTRDVVQRQLAYPDELMVLKSDHELVFVENLNPIRGHKLSWFHDPVRKHLGRNLHKE